MHGLWMQPMHKPIGIGMGYQGVWGYTGWQGNGYGYGYYQAYSAGYQQGLSDAHAGLDV